VLSDNCLLTLHAGQLMDLDADHCGLSEKNWFSPIDRTGENQVAMEQRVMPKGGFIPEQLPRFRGK
jgi:hypothetical protein